MMRLRASAADAEGAAGVSVVVAAPMLQPLLRALGHN
jgi:hypothetical protein